MVNQEHIKTEGVIGIDPGKSGAICFYDGSNVEVIDFKKSTEHECSMFLADRKEQVRMAYLESVHAMPGQGVSSSFNFGSSFGFCRGILVANRIPFQLVSPIKWQNYLQCRTKGDKNVTKSKCYSLFPDLEFRITHQLADSILIAYYGFELWRK
tara:strand:+ start:573 stop:1034 length:462 start_codon:yes stop_codon:yes gene_type:complete